MLVLGFGERLSSECCSEWGCVKAAKGSSGLLKGFHCEHYFTGDLGELNLVLGS